MAIIPKRINKLRSVFAVSIFALILILPFGNAFIDNFGDVFGQMGDSLSGFVDNLYKNVDSWADHVIEHAKGEECQYFCPNGKQPSQNKNYEHKPTGCGTVGLKIKESDLPVKGMGLCCDKHQMCYHKCGADKNECDLHFNKCLLQKCRESQKDPALIKGCRTATKLLMMSFLTFGCKSFKDSQKNACVCNGTDEL